ncbi:hypothetical protein GCM10017600_83240 [Streptosporangium carneum]|uniref:Uncharacterized protein n=1 Tax=Streptosporangium carneum TaxID=47481 RepID=A0A9W6IA44_9ACTN|nr:hypothetical protein GCM10017600_83240 [Streptosporangium carneum]
MNPVIDASRGGGIRPRRQGWDPLEEGGTRPAQPLTPPEPERRRLRAGETEEVPQAVGRRPPFTGREPGNEAREPGNEGLRTRKRGPRAEKRERAPGRKAGRPFF